MSRAKRTDQNQPEIVAALRKIGCKVAVTSSAGEGFPDIVLYTPHLNRILLIEIKDGDKPPSRQSLTPAQVLFHTEWSDCPDVIIINSVDQAIKVATVA